MTLLMSSPEPAGEWSWELEPKTSVNLETALSHASSIGHILAKHELATPTLLSINWTGPEIRTTGLATDILVHYTPTNEWHNLVVKSKPQGYSQAIVSRIKLTGPGTWVDQDGNNHNEKIMEVKVTYVEDLSIAIRLCTYNDVWSKFDFRGNPQMDVYNANAPRLKAALQSLAEHFDEAPEPGEPTYFGVPTTYGVNASKDWDGNALDVTDRL